MTMEIGNHQGSGIPAPGPQLTPGKLWFLCFAVLLHIRSEKYTLNTSVCQTLRHTGDTVLRRPERCPHGDYIWRKGMGIRGRANKLNNLSNFRRMINAMEVTKQDAGMVSHLEEICFGWQGHRWSFGWGDLVTDRELATQGSGGYTKRLDVFCLRQYISGNRGSDTRHLCCILFAKVKSQFTPTQGEGIITRMGLIGMCLPTPGITKDLPDLAGWSHANLCLSQGLCIWSRGSCSQVKESSSTLKDMLVALQPSPKNSQRNVSTR